MKDEDSLNRYINMLESEDELERGVHITRQAWVKTERDGMLNLSSVERIYTKNLEENGFVGYCVMADNYVLEVFQEKQEARLAMAKLFLNINEVKQ